MQNWWGDPACWHDAMSSILESFACSSIEFDGTHFEFIPFGAGRRMCQGVTFGLTSIELSSCLTTIPFWLGASRQNDTRRPDMSDEFG